MITIDENAYGVPSAESLEAMANELFPDLVQSEYSAPSEEFIPDWLIPDDTFSGKVPSTGSAGEYAGAYAPNVYSEAEGYEAAKQIDYPTSLTGDELLGKQEIIPQGANTDSFGSLLTDTPSYAAPSTEGLEGLVPEAANPGFGAGEIVVGVRQPEKAPAASSLDEEFRTGHSSVNRNSSIIIGSKNLQQIRDDFPILQEKVNGYPLVWLDNGATTQRPNAVIDRLDYYYRHENSNVHRGAHELAARSTDAYENARQTVADFIGAPSKDDIIFVRGTTEGINLVAHSYVKPTLQPGDEIIVSILEHHANIVPWQIIAAETGAVLKVIPCDDSGQLILSEYERLFTRQTKFVSVTQVSNVLGTVTPIHEIIQLAHKHGVRILVDGAQSVAHMPVNVSALDADFFVFSGHKIFAPTGIGAVYGKKELLAAAKPYHGGGNMIKDGTFERTIYNPAPNKFEAGTGSIADAVGLGAALEYLNKIGMPSVNAWEQELLQYGLSELKKVHGLHLVGTAAHKASALAFKLDGYSDDEVGARLNNYGIAVRTGHHCAQPVLRRFGLESTVRPTIALYNSPDDIDALVRALKTFA